MKNTATLLAACLITAFPTSGQSQSGDAVMVEGLTKAYEAHCNGVIFALWYSPQSDVAHMRDESPSKFDRDRLTMVVTNIQQPANRRFAFTEPKPFAGFARLFRKTSGRWIDITAEQIDPHHSGSPAKVNMRFEAVGDAYASTIVYPAFTAIVNPQDIESGDYVLRLAKFPYLEVEGQPCPLNLPDLPISVH